MMSRVVISEASASFKIFNQPWVEGQYLSAHGLLIYGRISRVYMPGMGRCYRGARCLEDRSGYHRWYWFSCHRKNKIKSSIHRIYKHEARKRKKFFYASTLRHTATFPYSPPIPRAPRDSSPRRLPCGMYTIRYRHQSPENLPTLGFQGV